MTDEMLMLGRRAVACRAWRWMPGMLLYGNGLRVFFDSTETMNAWGMSRRPRSTDVPDLTDPATLGCLLALVREAWGDDDVSTARVGVLADGRPEWAVRTHWGATRQVYGPSEAAALVAALEAA